MACTFDHDFCHWKQSKQDNTDWISIKGPTPSEGTGPTSDHTGDGFYIYVDGRYSEEGQFARLESPECELVKNHCFNFWYHMYGTAKYMELRVYVVTDEGLENIVYIEGDQGDMWHYTEVLLLNRGNIQIFIDGVIGETILSDVAVDDITIYPGYCSGPPTTSTTRSPSGGTTATPTTFSTTLTTSSTISTITPSTTSPISTTSQTPGSTLTSTLPPSISKTTSTTTQTPGSPVTTTLSPSTIIKTSTTTQTPGSPVTTTLPPSTSTTTSTTTKTPGSPVTTTLPPSTSTTTSTTTQTQGSTLTSTLSPSTNKPTSTTTKTPGSPVTTTLPPSTSTTTSTTTQTPGSPVTTTLPPSTSTTTSTTTKTPGSPVTTTLPPSTSTTTSTTTQTPGSTLTSTWSPSTSTTTSTTTKTPGSPVTTTLPPSTSTTTSTTTQTPGSPVTTTLSPSTSKTTSTTTKTPGSPVTTTLLPSTSTTTSTTSQTPGSTLTSTWSPSTSTTTSTTTKTPGSPVTTTLPPSTSTTTSTTTQTPGSTVSSTVPPSAGINTVSATTLGVTSEDTTTTTLSPTSDKTISTLSTSTSTSLKPTTTSTSETAFLTSGQIASSTTSDFTKKTTIPALESTSGKPIVTTAGPTAFSTTSVATSVTKTQTAPTSFTSETSTKSTSPIISSPAATRSTQKTTTLQSITDLTSAMITATTSASGKTTTSDSTSTSGSTSQATTTTLSSTTSEPIVSSSSLITKTIPTVDSTLEITTVTSSGTTGKTSLGATGFTTTITASKPIPEITTASSTTGVTTSSSTLVTSSETTSTAISESLKSTSESISKTTATTSETTSALTSKSASTTTSSTSGTTSKASIVTTTAASETSTKTGSPIISSSTHTTSSGITTTLSSASDLTTGTPRTTHSAAPTLSTSTVASEIVTSSRTTHTYPETSDRPNIQHKMSDSPQLPPSDWQTIINSAVAASVEKAIGRLLMQNPKPDTATDLPTEVMEDVLPGDLHAIKRQRKGTVSDTQRQRGKAPVKKSRQAARREPSPPYSPSSEDDDRSPPPSLDIMDEWKAGASHSEDEDWLDVQGEDRECDQDTYLDQEEGTFIDPQGTAMFDPRTIRHPRSTEWGLPDHLAQFIHFWLRKPMDKEVRARLRAECPRPTLPDKIAVTPEFDSTVSLFMSRAGRDPRKGIEKGLRESQDKLLDILGPLAKMLYLADLALSQGTTLDAHTIREWAQRAICMLGNTNAAMCAERRRTALLKMDPKLMELGKKEMGPLANGQLFGDSFITELKKHVSIFTTLNKAQTSIKQVFRNTAPRRGVFARAGRQRGRATSRFWPTGPRHQSSQAFFPTSRSNFQRGSFRSRGTRTRGRGRFNAGMGKDILGQLDPQYSSRLRDRILRHPGTGPTPTTNKSVGLTHRNHRYGDPNPVRQGGGGTRPRRYGFLQQHLRSPKENRRLQTGHQPTLSTMVLYETNEAGNGLPKREGHPLPNIPGRYFDILRISTQASISNEIHSALARVFGFHHQQRKIFTPTSQGGSIPGIRNRFENVYSPLASGPSKRSSRRIPPTMATNGSLRVPTVFNVGESPPPPTQSKDFSNLDHTIVEEPSMVPGPSSSVSRPSATPTSVPIPPSEPGRGTSSVDYTRPIGTGGVTEKSTTTPDTSSTTTLTYPTSTRSTTTQHSTITTSPPGTGINTVSATTLDVTSEDTTTTTTLSPTSDKTISTLSTSTSTSLKPTTTSTSETASLTSGLATSSTTSDFTKKTTIPALESTSGKTIVTTTGPSAFSTTLVPTSVSKTQATTTDFISETSTKTTSPIISSPAATSSTEKTTTLQSITDLTSAMITATTSASGKTTPSDSTSTSGSTSQATTTTTTSATTSEPIVSSSSITKTIPTVDSTLEISTVTSSGTTGKTSLGATGFTTTITTSKPIPEITTASSTTGVTTSSSTLESSSETTSRVGTTISESLKSTPGSISKTTATTSETTSALTSKTASTTTSSTSGTTSKASIVTTIAASETSTKTGSPIISSSTHTTSSGTTTTLSSASDLTTGTPRTTHSAAPTLSTSTVASEIVTSSRTTHTYPETSGSTTTQHSTITTSPPGTGINTVSATTLDVTSEDTTTTTLSPASDKTISTLSTSTSTSLKSTTTSTSETASLTSGLATSSTTSDFTKKTTIPALESTSGKTSVTTTGPATFSTTLVPTSVSKTQVTTTDFISETSTKTTSPIISSPAATSSTEKTTTLQSTTDLTSAMITTPTSASGKTTTSDLTSTSGSTSQATTTTTTSATTSEPIVSSSSITKTIPTVDFTLEISTVTSSGTTGKTSLGATGFTTTITTSKPIPEITTASSTTGVTTSPSTLVSSSETTSTVGTTISESLKSTPGSISKTTATTSETTSALTSKTASTTTSSTSGTTSKASIVTTTAASETSTKTGSPIISSSTHTTSSGTTTTLSFATDLITETITATSSGQTSTITPRTTHSATPTPTTTISSEIVTSSRTTHTYPETPGLTEISTTTPVTSSSTTLTYPTSTRSTTTQHSTITSTISPLGPGSCVVEGDPHYHTFDNQLHNFMGICTYTLSKVCGDDGHLPIFNVEAANENKGNPKVSYVKYVNVDVHGYRITLDKGRQVTVNGKIVVLPTDLPPEIKIFLSGNNVVVTTGFGLKVTFDGNHKVVVTIPGNYANKVCGLCGNFNGNKNDDFINPEGELEPNSTSLGNSWQVENDTRCLPATDHMPECTDEDKNTIASNSFCGLITDIIGPFKDCHSVINPLEFFNTCVYDLCELNMDPEILCSSLQSYADICQSQGVTIQPWRNETFCPPTCPSNSHYEQCGTACPATCVNPGSSSNCNLPCAEGCFCDPGYVLYDKKCVPSDQCGCWDGDKYYPVGTEFWSDDTCSSKCTCPSPGSGLVCKSESCPSNQYCGITNGVPGCYFYVFGICRVHNDPHYDTFDRQNHNFMGLCTYTLAKLCSNSSSLPYFNVEAKNAHRGDPSVSFVEKVFIEVYDQKVQIWRHEQNRVLVNGIWTTLPVNLVEGLVTVTWTGKYVSLQTDFRLTVSYDTDSSVEVKVPSTYSSLTCGMCGNFNNRKSDEYLMPNGEQAPNSEVLGHSWIVEDDDPLCHPTDPEPTPLPVCPPEKEELYASNEFCGLLTSKDGPFYICNSVISPAGFFESCIFDMCALNGDQDVLCSLLGAYADACQKEGVSLNWRNSTICVPKCPANSHYNVCMSSCPATCLQPHGPENCSSPCLEGCECDDGYVISGGTCVSKSNCGCWYNETYFNEGEKFLQGDCENSCECLGNNNVVCSPVSCAKDEICKVQNGTLGCYPPSTAVCHIYGDPHYTTFDGTLHHFQGSCTYTVTETCEDTSNNFTITTRNEHRGNPSWTAINSVALTVDGTHISLQKNNIVFVNNAQVTLPVNLSGINIIQSGRYVVVTTDFGLELQFDGDHELFVRIKENYKGKLCGLCGTYNDDRKDDFMTPDGNVVQDVNDFGNSWRVEDNEWPCDSTPPPPPTCPPSLTEEAEKMCWIIKQTDGPFRPCHSYLRPHLYFESCVFDQCATGGSIEQLCNVLESYAAACKGLGVSLGDWINNTICDPNATTPPSVSSTTHPEPSVSKTTITPSTAKTTITDPGSSSSVSTTTKTSTTGTTPIPPSSGSCVVQGDPHYQTFDNQLHHFMGTCTYTLSKVCGDDGHLPPFNVEAANEHRGNTKVSYVKYVNVDVHGFRITLDKGRQVMVNGKIEVLPINLSPDIKVFISGNNVLLTTGFGLQVAFDGNHKVVVTIPGNYYNKVCGLCGNFNGNKNDDFLNPEGELEPNSTSLGNSWQVENDTRCSPGEDHTPECTDEDKNTIASSSFCGLITDNNGPFRDCHNVINPSIYFDTCVYDLCELNMDPGSLCNSLQSYAEVCQSQGVTIYPWRNETFCPLKCPSNSHYDQCGTACPATCVPGSSSNCNLPCAEGCFCNDGYVLYDKKCVPSDQCGCWDGDKYYPVGTEFWSDDTCSSKCTCPSPGSGLVCKSESCPSNQYCGITNGVPGCYFYVFGICRVHNDPHYDTFDRQNHNFMGLCTYTLAKLCSNSSSLPYFNIEAKNAHRGDPSVSFVEKVFIEVYDQKVQIWRHEQNRVLVNGIWTTLPVNLVEGLVTVTWTGKYVSLQTDFRLTVSYDTDSSVEVKVPSTYSSLTCGMCGNFNNRKSDEYLMPNGVQAPNSEVLGHSWIVEDDDPLCHPTDPEPTPVPACPPEKQELFESKEFCGLLTSKDGPFYICNSVINPAGFFESCIFDMCALDGDQDVFCSLLGAYADACQKEGVSLNWRNSTLCQPKCPANSHYNVCMSSCPATCLQPHGPENCSSPCLEGCECDDGYVISGGTCVSKSNCGCWYNETYFNEGEKFLQGDCENSCECHGNNNVVCSPVSCAKDEICKVQNGTLGCYPPSTAVCHIYGDPHYTTFDGTLHHFQGSCTYTVTETCEDTSNNFTITTRNEHRGNPSWTAINSVALTVDGTHILLEKNNIVFVNNAQVTLPVNLPGINIIQSGRYVIVTTDFGLELQFNGDHELFVRIKENYKGKLCGLCGTYNDDRKDDFMTPDGNVVQDVNDFGNSWRVEDNEWPCDSITPPTPTCPPLLEEEAEKMCWIIKQTDGPFRPCHSYLRPHLYFESCIFDQCVTGGSKEQLCNVLESYAAACEALGVSLGDWISKTVCDPNATTPPPVATTTHPGPNVTTPPPHATTTHPGPDVTTPPPHATTTHPGPDVTTPPPHATTTHPGPDVTTPPPHATTTHPGPDVTTPPPHATTTHPGPDVTTPPPHATTTHPGPDVTTPPPHATTTHPGPDVTTPPPHATTTHPGPVVTTPPPHATTTHPAPDVTTPSPVATTTHPAATRATTTPPKLEHGICSASGDPHYNTFDNNVHHYMGNCSYTLSKLCNGSHTDLPYFHVYTTNEHRKSNTKVSYVQSVHVEIYNNTIDLLKNKKLNINGIRRNVPITSDSRYRVYISGNYLLVETDFGLRVKFDGNHYVDVYLPSDYKGQVCGLCGNYNGLPTDDFIKPDGSLAINSKELGDSWIVSEDTASCGSQDTGSCEPSLEEEYSKITYCGILTDPTGIFKECHSLVDVGNFFESCKQDMCFTGGESTSLCYAVQAYAQKCSEAGVCIEWRSETFCPISCPGSSHYKNCGSECPTTCHNSSSPTLCKSMSVEGCFCDAGFVLSGDRCVSEADCGCMDTQNNFYELGESWYTHENCTERCTCSKSNTITCAPWECGILQTCINDNGVIGCHSSGKGACHISGDPHFFTFDKVMHTFMGTCTYILVTLCDNRNVVPVTVSGKTEDRGQRAATYLKEVYIDVYDIRITLQKGKRILVDNEQINSPWVGHVKGISIQTVGLYVVVETDFGMIAKFDGDHHLEIILPDSYYNKVCGMCGNFNVEDTDELLMQNGLQANNVTQFGNSWKSIKDSDANCVDDDRNDLNPQCVAAQKPAIETQCKVLLSDTFKACHGIVDPNLFVQSCIYDMCRYNGMVSTLCAIFQAYVDACRSEGVNIKWRSSSLCPLACPTHSHYTECVSLCPPTCNDIYASAVCDKPNKCVEGCVCNDGYVLSDDKCVPLKSCGCRDTNDKYYSVDESWIKPHCAEKCQCTKGNKIICKSFSCPHGICALNSQGKYNCKPSGFAKCTISGDPHYRTFDGLTHHFQGKETYMLVQTSSTMPDYMEPFKIEGKNVPMTKFSPFTLLKELRIEVYNQVILFTENKKLVVNGVKTVPPSQPHDGIKIYQKPSRIYLETDFGLSVSFDGAENGEITVPSTYRDVLQGLCGNYDGINSNDFTLPGGTTVRDVNSFGNSWNVKLLKTRIRREAETSKLNEAEEPLDTGDNLVCSASQLTFVNSTSFCGTLRDTEGPFKNCLQSISSAPFIENCLFDTCAEFRSTDLLCINLEQYAIACLQNGTNIDGWRNTTGCERTCSSNSQYKDRMSSCPASCSNLASESECEDADTEGCECEDGYVLSGYECVPFKDCGCTYLNNYYPIGEVFLTEDCSQNCTCSEGSYVNCVDNECKDGEVCTTSNQTLGCYLPSPCLENPCENGGTCVVVEELNSTVAVCHCPKTYIGELCENAVDDYNESVIYIVIGVVLGIFAISCLIILAASLYFRSSKKKKGIIDSLDSSEGGRSSYRSTSESQGVTGPGNVFNLKYEEAPSINNADINVNIRTVDNDKAVDNADETSGDLVELVVLDKDTSANNGFENIYVETLSEGLGGVSNPAFEPDVTDSNFYENVNVKTEESTNANNSEDTDKENPKENEDKKQPVAEVETKSEESTGVSNPAFEPDITESNDVKEENANVKNEEVSNANKPEDPKAEMPAVTTDENKLVDNDRKDEISLNEKSKEDKNAEVTENDPTGESTQL
ncbi:uncharacterized protein LOC134586215 [Pelobates fuscus]|uniref:uncharacterized protein LOC134586215 n=1 Tax=Pelobates fuscus TaxID=191477 RepID=UPI002FE46A43